MEGKSLILERHGQVGVLILNRPEKLNAINAEMRAQFASALEEVQDDDGIRALILTGAGKGFCSGADLASPVITGAPAQEEPSRKAVLKLVGDMVLGFEKTNKPIIAAINGVAAGIGLTLALACDVRLASTNARFAALWVKRGLIADGGATFLLPLAVGMEKALELCYTGDVIDAAEAERIRLVSRVVPAGELMQRATELAEKIASGPPIPIELMKKLMWENIRGVLREQLIAESYAQNVCRTTRDQKEAVAAFIEKRQPVFRGS